MQCVAGDLRLKAGFAPSLTPCRSPLAGTRLRSHVALPPHSKRATLQSPRAISYSDEDIFGHRHHPQGPPARELSEEEKQQRVESETERIKQQTQQRAEKLRREAHLKHLDHELKFGKLMFSQGSYDSALAHFNKVVEGSAPDSYHRGEGTLQKASCLEKLGRETEAHALYESLIRFRAPYPNIKRRAAQALFGATGDSASAPRYDDYMYRMFMSGFGTYMPKEKYVETKEEKVLLRFLPWAILLMAPMLLISLLFFPQ